MIDKTIDILNNNAHWENMFSSKDDPDAPSKCPSCSKDIGVDNNTYRFQVVDFTAETDGNQRSAGRVIAVSCSNCKKVLGFVNQ
jgi:hypothetical protein